MMLIQEKPFIKLKYDIRFERINGVHVRTKNGIKIEIKYIDGI